MKKLLFGIGSALAIVLVFSTSAVFADSSSLVLSCEDESVVVSDETNMVEGGGSAVLTYDGSPRWTVSIPGAEWIWKTFFVGDPVGGETETFIKEFEIESDINAATLKVSADNSYKFWINDVLIGEDPGEFNYQNVDEYQAESFLVQGTNTIKAEVENWKQNNATAESNPAGLLYRLDVVFDCSPTVITECSDNSDNDGDGKTDIDDAGCHTDGDPNNPNSYDPNDDDENSKPVITLIGDNPFEVIQNQTFSDSGATAEDKEDGDITANIVVAGTVDTAILGDYILSYDVTDSDGLAADTVTRTVKVVSGGGGGGSTPECSDGNDNDGDGLADENDPACHTDGDPNNPNSYDPNDDDENSKPVITLIGNNPIEIETGDSSFTDPGATANDEEDGDITANIVVTGSVDVDTPGDYVITYNVADSDGLAADPATRTVRVSDDNGGGGGGGGRRNNNNDNDDDGQVLGTSIPNCEYLRDFLHKDWNNDWIEVAKLQAFLNVNQGYSEVAINGVFDDATYEAVKKFQVRYNDEVLNPWGYEDNEPTGFVYITTRKKINEIYCNTAFPLSDEQLLEIAEYRLAGLVAEVARLGGGDNGIGGSGDGSKPGVGSNIVIDDKGNVLGGTTSEEMDRSETKEKTCALCTFASFALSSPETLPDILGCIFSFLLSLALIYIVASLIVGFQNTENLSVKQVRIRKLILFVLGTIVALLVAVLFDLYCLIIPLIAVLVILAAGLLWYGNGNGSGNGSGKSSAPKALNEPKSKPVTPVQPATEKPKYPFGHEPKPQNQNNQTSAGQTNQKPQVIITPPPQKK